MAACSAARDDEKTEVLERKMEVVRFLVEELGCDVDGMDAKEGERFGGYYGTPVNYVAHGGRGGEAVVRYLLEVSLLGVFVLCGVRMGRDWVWASLALRRPWLTFDDCSERRESGDQRLLGSNRCLWLREIGEQEGVGGSESVETAEWNINPISIYL